MAFRLNIQNGNGLLLLGNTGSNSFTQDKIEETQAFVRTAAEAIQTAWQIHLDRQYTQQIESVRVAALALTSSLDLETVLDAILQNLLQLRPDVADIHLFLGDENHLEFASAVWAGDKKEKPISEPRKDGVTYTTANRKEALIVEDTQTHPLFENMPKDFCSSIIGLPLLFNDQVVGVMNVGFGQARTFSQRELHFLYIFRDQAAIAIENARLHTLITKQSLTDPLTGLLNRRAFDEHLQFIHLTAKRHNQPFSLLLFDMDGFKNINDKYGHPAGDQVLICTSENIQTILRQTDHFARIGGDEFAILLPQTDLSQAINLAERIRVTFKSCQKQIPHISPWPTTSIGIATYPFHTKSIEHLLQLADQALYDSKSTSPGAITTASTS